MIEWAHDSSWRFLAAVYNKTCGYVMHPMDLTVDKLLTLVGRDEPRDFLDILYIHKNVLPLGALIWAAVGKDPGFTPLSLLGLLKRRGKYREEDFARLHLASPVDLRELKFEWLDALESAEKFIGERDPSEVGCLYYSVEKREFFAPEKDSNGYQLHFGRPGGFLPAVSR